MRCIDMKKIVIDGVTYVQQKESNAMKTIGVRLPKDIVESLEQSARVLNTSKTALMRSYICKGLNT